MFPVQPLVNRRRCVIMLQTSGISHGKYLIVASLEATIRYLVTVTNQCENTGRGKCGKQSYMKFNGGRATQQCVRIIAASVSNAVTVESTAYSAPKLLIV